MRGSDGGYVYHLLNRAVGRATLFAKPADYAAFEKILRQAWERLEIRLLGYTIMPNQLAPRRRAVGGRGLKHVRWEKEPDPLSFRRADE
jgi:hypothetical protein